jgi:hypothetical protein
MQMKVAELGSIDGMRLIAGGADPDTEILSVYAADTMSELIAHASAGTLLLTHLDNAQLVRVAELMDAPAICLLDGARPGDELLAAAAAAGAAVLVSGAGRVETLRALEGRLASW